MRDSQQANNPRQLVRLIEGEDAQLKSFPAILPAGKRLMGPLSDALGW